MTFLHVSLLVSIFGNKGFQIIRSQSRWTPGRKALVNYSSELINEVTVMLLGITKWDQSSFKYAAIEV